MQEYHYQTQFFTWREVETTVDYRPHHPGFAVDGIVLDVDTPGPHRPAPQRDLSVADAAIIDGQLQLTEYFRPVTHFFDLRTGEELRTEILPSPIGAHPHTPSTPAKITAPRGWSIMDHFHDNLVGLWDPENMIAAVGRVGTFGRVTVGPLRVFGRLIGNAMKFGEGYAVSLGWGSGYFLDEKLQVVKEINDGRGVPVPIGELAGYEGEEQIDYLDPATGEALCTLPKVEFRTRLVAATPTLVAHLIDERTLHLWEEGEYRTVELNYT